MSGNTLVKVYVLPGGKLPERKTDGAIGYDVSLRAIVSPKEMDAENPVLRKVLFDFKNPPEDPELLRHVLTVSSDEKLGAQNELVYNLDPGESVLGGIGFITEMSFPMFYWVAPRSGLASKYGITVTNAPGTVDPDYRGEAGVLIYNRSSVPFFLRHNMRIAQIIFQWAIIPELLNTDIDQLLSTNRGAGGFGSTGIL
ncbi:MAG TPA: dUTP diphosphatase [Candidatus Paceibacterota bacterium]